MFISVSLFFSGLFSCSFNWEYFLCFSFYWTLSASMNLGETFTYCGLEQMFLCENVPILTMCAQCLWWVTDLKWMLLFSENSSTCTCIFNVFMGGRRWTSILLLLHLISPQIHNIFEAITWCAIKQDITVNPKTKLVSQRPLHSFVYFNIILNNPNITQDSITNVNNQTQ